MNDSERKAWQNSITERTGIYERREYAAPSTSSCFDLELELRDLAVLLNGRAADLRHVLDDEVSAAVLNFASFVTGAYCNNCCSTCNTSTDPRRTVFKDDTSASVETQTFSSKQEWVWRGLPGLQTLIVSSNSYRGRCDPNTGHGSIS